MESIEAAPKVDVVVDETLLLLARENVRLTGEEVVRKQKKIEIYVYLLASDIVFW